MGVVGPVLLIVLGLETIRVGWRLRSKDLALVGLTGAALGAVPLIWNGGVAIRYISLPVVAILVLAVMRSSLGRVIWRGTRVEALLGGAIVALVFTSELVTNIPQMLERGLLVLIAGLGLTFIGRILFRVAKNDFSPRLS